MATGEIKVGCLVADRHTGLVLGRVTRVRLFWVDFESALLSGSVYLDDAMGVEPVETPKSGPSVHSFDVGWVNTPDGVPTADLPPLAGLT